MKHFWIVLALAFVTANGTAAQQPVKTGRGFAHYGKWLGAALAATFIALGAHEHSSSDRAFTELLGMCRANNADCRRNPDGTYVNTTAEQLYQSSLTFDRRAQVRLIAAQASVLVTAALFLADHGRGGGVPENIPLHGLSVDVRGDGARVGFRVRF